MTSTKGKQTANICPKLCLNGVFSNQHGNCSEWILPSNGLILPPLPLPPNTPFSTDPNLYLAAPKLKKQRMQIGHCYVSVLFQHFQGQQPFSGDICLMIKSSHPSYLALYKTTHSYRFVFLIMRQQIYFWKRQLQKFNLSQRGKKCNWGPRLQYNLRKWGEFLIKAWRVDKMQPSIKIHLPPERLSFSPVEPLTHFLPKRVSGVISFPQESSS